MFEEEKLRYAPGGSERSQAVALNVGGVAQLSVSRRTFTQCEDSMLAASFGGNWDLPTDPEGRVFVDFSPDVFLPLVEHLRQRRIEDPMGAPTPPPPPFADSVTDERFLDMLRHYGVLDWVYRQQPVQHQVRIGEYSYAVLPPQPPETARTLNE